MPILYAPILEQAGFISSGSEPVVNYVARTDGVSQYWQLETPLPVSVDEDFQLSLDVNAYYGGSPLWISIFSGGGINVWFTKSNGSIGDIKVEIGSRINTGINWLEGVESNLVVERVDGFLTVTYNNQSYTIYRTGAFEVDSIGSFNGGDYLDGFVRNFSFSKGSTIMNEIPLTNKAQGATQLATVGSVNAFMPNYTPDVWEVEP